eukprot:TRINITY_DN9380_c0_g2_i2.p1 TRINITY_DN9380_c0_g2~~TRINITY_DN9380_c0_g2_i2.p1  ORF type:complete len:312 (-),score=66.84 TRINITY_DN9380_c0_g2_i2:41-976(-)
MEQVAKLLEKSSLNFVVKSCVWCIAKLCEGKPAPPLDQILPAFDALARTLQGRSDKNALTWAAEGLLSLSDSGSDRISCIIATGIVPRLVELIGHKEAFVFSCMRTIGNITYGNEEQTQAVINANGLPTLAKVLRKANRQLKKDACWVLSNIAAGSSSQVEALFENKLMYLIIDQVVNETLEIKKEAMWVIANATNKVTQRQIEHFLELKLVNALAATIQSPDSELVAISLRVFDNILSGAREWCGKTNKVAMQTETQGCLQSIEKLQYHQNQMIYKLASEIVRKYFQLQEPEDVLTAPASISNGISIFDF